jgi:hypothetical protein
VHKGCDRPGELMALKKAGANVVDKRTNKKDCIDDFIKSVPVFLHLSDDALGEVRKYLYKKQYAQGKKVFEKGDTNSTLYIVEAGKIAPLKKPRSIFITLLLHDIMHRQKKLKIV